MLQRLWLRVRAFIARLFRREVAPGRFEAGHASSLRGLLTTAPLVAPSRDYLVYVPRGHSRLRRAPLIVLCHGCRQTPEDIAGLTHITEHADRSGSLVLLPRQVEGANAYRCWNWFEANTSHGGGEAAIVAAQIVAVRRRYRARRERVWVIGLSAGAALGAVLGLRYPRLVRGVVAHSGLACGAASSPATALTVMKHGPDNDVARVADSARAADGDPHQAVPLLVIQGDRDDVVDPINGVALIDQYLRFNAHPAGHDGYRAAAALPSSDAMAHEAATDARHGTRTDDWIAAGRVVVRHVTIEGLTHAWTGGNGDYAFADSRGPDALELFARFAKDSRA
ncbi:MAG TPA: PHB depolymerase family esterase [Casimicrobiaceae bacterium]|nr:PHB depolymerase family esterase [Casimicrobiaceae bacterium]